MTATEFHIAFKLGLDKIDSENYPNFISSEVDFILNQAQERIVKQRLGLNNIKREGFEETQKRTDDLRTIVVSTTIIPNNPTSTNKPGGRYCNLPSDYYFAVNEDCDLEVQDCNGKLSLTKNVLIKPIRHDNYSKVIYDPFNQPYEGQILRLMTEGKVELIADLNHIVKKYYLRYIKKPQSIDITIPQSTDLPEHLHQEIVEEAVYIALENIQAQRNQTFNKILGTEE